LVQRHVVLEFRVGEYGSNADPCAVLQSVQPALRKPLR